MSWLYVPGMAVSKPVSSAFFEKLASSVTSKEKHSPPRTWRRRCKRAYWLTRLSGLTFGHSTASRGVTRFIASLQASPVNPSQTQDASARSTITDGSGRRSIESFAKYDPGSSSWKTCLALFDLDSTECSETWPQAGSMRNGICSQRPRPARPIGGNDSSALLPTPTATPYGSTNNGDPGDGRGEYATKGTPSLETMARRGHFITTPTVGDSRQSGGRDETEGAKDGTSLTDWARVRGTDRVLNPAFVEWMMGIDPIGLTDFACSGTGSYPDKPNTRSEPC